MFLEELKIEGYKNFRESFTISFSKSLNILVGENGAGKSAVIDSIRKLLLEDEFGRTPVSESDFHRPFQPSSKHADSYRISCSFGGLSKEEIVAFLPWTDLEEKASLTLEVDNKPTYKGRYKRTLWGGDSRSSIFEWELFDTINCIYLPPLRDAEAKLREGKGSRLARLLKNLNKKAITEATSKGKLHPLEQKVLDFNKELAGDEDETIAKANKLISNLLNEALGSVFGQDTHIQFSETNFNRIVESLRLLFFPDINSSASQDMFRNLEENSLGYNNMLYLATVLAELTQEIDNTAEYLKILLIEEPEAHLHPQLQIRLLKYLEKAAKEKNVQIIVTTHSTVLASAVSLESLIHMSSSKEAGEVAVPLGACGLNNGSENFISRWLDATKSTLLFARGVILVEGIAEAMLLPELSKLVLSEYNSGKQGKKILPSSLEDCGVSVINMNGIYFKHFMQLFCDLDDLKSSENIPIRCSGITDNDPPKYSKVKEKKVPIKPTQEKKYDGENHALKLVPLVNKSTMARLFSNELKTFEYDLAMEGGNLNVMIPVAKSLIDTDGDIKKKYEEFEKVKWEKCKNLKKKANASYYLLTHIEKGEFAQSLADQLLNSTIAKKISIPMYIKNAVVWACGGDYDLLK